MLLPGNLISLISTTGLLNIGHAQETIENTGRHCGVTGVFPPRT